jgi:putative ABC transport system ATP-binding protein
MMDANPPFANPDVFIHGYTIHTFYRLKACWYNFAQQGKAGAMRSGFDRDESKNGRSKAGSQVVSAQGNGVFLRLEGIGKSYQEGDQRRRVFHNIGLHLSRGEVVAIVGKSGSGKTTLLNLISGIDQFDEGEIFLEQRRLTGLDERAWTLFRRKSIGFIFQFFNLIPTLSVWENVILPLELNGKNTAQDFHRAEELLEAVGLADRKMAFPDRLSGGEQQRVAIARALVHDPLLVLADEPTGNLDEETGRQVLALLERLTRQTGKSMILVTHSMEAAAIADRAFTLREGLLVERTAVA